LILKNEYPESERGRGGRKRERERERERERNSAILLKHYLCSLRKTEFIGLSGKFVPTKI